ncbi:MAG: Asp23/Gls24 family envelope stress response protein [Chloroflexota bacterium]|jgi:uncharacterized alkaline shock family protein YloU
MSTSPRPSGKTTVAPGVLLTIVRLTTLKVPGVSYLSPYPGNVNRLFGFSRQRSLQANDGVHIEIKDDMVYADLHLVLKGDMNVRDISHNVQREVACAISKTIGMEVGRIDIHIEDIDYSLVEK